MTASATFLLLSETLPALVWFLVGSAVQGVALSVSESLQRHFGRWILKIKNEGRPCRRISPGIPNVWPVGGSWLLDIFPPAFGNFGFSCSCCLGAMSSLQYINKTLESNRYVSRGRSSVWLFIATFVENIFEKKTKLS